MALGIPALPLIKHRNRCGRPRCGEGELSIPHRLFLSHLLGGDSLVNAYSAAFPNARRSTTYAESVRLRDKLAGSKAFAEILDQAGIDDVQLVIALRSLLDAEKSVFFCRGGKVTDMRKVPDHRSRLKALVLVLKLKGLIPARGQP